MGMTTEPATEEPTGASAPVDRDPGRTGPTLLAATLPLLGLVGGWTLAASLQPADYSAVSESVSALAATGTPHRWVMTTGLLVAATGWLGVAVLSRLPRVARAIMAVGGLGTLGVVLTPMASRSESNALHVAF